MKKVLVTAAAAAALLGVGVHAASAGVTATACYQATVTIDDTTVSDGRCETVSAP